MSKKVEKKMKDEKKKRRCSRCRTKRGVIRKYNLNVCRRCFKDMAKQLGFSKYG